MVGLDDLKGLFQPIRFCDSVKSVFQSGFVHVQWFPLEGNPDMGAREEAHSDQVLDLGEQETRTPQRSVLHNLGTAWRTTTQLDEAEVLVIPHMQSKDKNVIGNSQHRFPKGGFCLSSLIAFYAEMTGSVDEGRALDNVYLDFSKVCNTVSPSNGNKLG
ncbi:hypothetical protein QYF61_015626 [Mycteria americana]|uniref:Uncharacterized protein n=1 Tax=Mycteria americana TaxID=33587 RepID=A0AAN7Q462_MYCAM|nr:hypothetical protein QYF61_015626 [Mycteria americana]